MDEQKISKRNIIAMIPEGALIFTAFTFLDTSSIVAVFIDSMTGSLQLAGAAIALRWICFLIPQLFVGPAVNSTKNLPRLITITALALRPLPLVMVPVLLSGLGPHSSVIILFAILAAFFIGEGLMNIPWWDVFGRTVPAESRGRVIGYQQFFGGIGSLLSGFIIKYVLDNAGINIGTKYSIIFGLGGLVALFSALLMLFLRDFPRELSKEPTNIFQSLKELPSHLKSNKALAKINAVQLISGISTAVIPLTILFCKNTFGLDTNQVSTLVYLQIAGNLAGGILWGSLSHRQGNKCVVVLSQILGLLLHTTAICCIIFGKATPFAVLGIIVLLAGIYAGNWLGFSNYIIDIAGDSLRAVYILINSIFTFPSTVLYYIAGLIAGSAGFVPLYAAGGVAAFSAIILSLRLKSTK